MAKLAVLFLAALAFQATFAFERYETYGEDKLVNYLDEAKEFTRFLRNDFPEEHLAFKTLTMHFQRYAMMVEKMILKLREESFIKMHDETKAIKPVMHMLEEIYTILEKMTVYTNMTDKMSFIMDLETLFERLHELVRVTYTFPEFRFTLKYLIVDFMTTLHEVRTHFMYMNKHMEFNPTTTLLKIREFTRESTEIIKEFVHPTQMKVALRGYLKYVREILHQLEVETLLGDKEFDVLMHTLTNKLRDIVFPLMQINETNELVDMKMIKTQMITRFFEVVEVFEQMMHLMEMKQMPTEVKIFVEKMFNHYYYALEMIYNQIKFANKIGFFAPEYYNTEFYSKYGYGLYEKLFEKLYLTPFTYKTQMYSLFPMMKYETMPRFEMNVHNKNMDRFETPNMEILLKELLVKFETMDKHTFQYYVREFVQILDIIYDKLRPIENERTIEEFRMMVKFMKMYFEQMPIEDMRMFFITSLKLFTIEMYKFTTLEKFDNILFKEIFVTYTNFLYKMYKPMTTTFTTEKTHKDLMIQMHMLTEKVYQMKDMKTMQMTMYMRQFMTILEKVIDMMYKHIDYKHENPMMREIFFNLKQMKMELEHSMYFGGMMSNTYKMRFVQYIKYFTMEMEKLMTVEDFSMVMMKEVFVRYITFLQKFLFEANKYSTEYPVNTYSTMYDTKTRMPYFMTRYMKY